MNGSSHHTNGDGHATDQVQLPVPVEVNLAELPWFVAADRKVLHHRIQLAPGRSITMSCAHGVPTAFDADVYLLLCALAVRHGSHERVPFTLRSVLDMLGCSRYMVDRLKLSITRLYETVSTFEQCLYLDGRLTSVTSSSDFRFVPAFRLYDRRHTDLPLWDARDESWYSIQRSIYDNITRQYFRSIDLRELRRLRDGLAKRLYLLYSYRLSDGTSHSITTDSLATVLPLHVYTTWREPGRAHRILTRLHETLAAEAGIAYTYDRESDTYTVYRPGATPSTAAAPGIVAPPADRAAREIVSLFIRRTTGAERDPLSSELTYAQQLLERYGAERVHHLVDYAIRQASEARFMMRTFRALSVYESYGIADYESRISSAERRRQQEEEAARHARARAESDRLRAELDRLRTDDPQRYAALRSQAERNIRATYRCPDLAGEVGMDLEMIDILRREGHAI